MNMRKLRLTIAVTLIALVVIVALQNLTPVPLQLLFWNLTLPRALLIVIVLVIGVVIGWFLRAIARRARH